MDRLQEIEQELEELRKSRNVVYDQIDDLVDERNRLYVQNYITPENLQRTEWEVMDLTSSRIWASNPEVLVGMDVMFVKVFDLIKVNDVVTVGCEGDDIYLRANTLSEVLNFAVGYGLKVSAGYVEEEISRLEEQLNGLKFLKLQIDSVGSSNA